MRCRLVSTTRMRGSVAGARGSAHTPVALNGFGLWVAMMIALTVVNYGYPIAQLASLKEAYVPVIPIGSR